MRVTSSKVQPISTGSISQKLSPSVYAATWNPCHVSNDVLIFVLSDQWVCSRGVVVGDETFLKIDRFAHDRKVKRSEGIHLTRLPDDVEPRCRMTAWIGISAKRWTRMNLRRKIIIFVRRYNCYVPPIVERNQSLSSHSAGPDHTTTDEIQLSIAFREEDVDNF